MVASLILGGDSAIGTALASSLLAQGQSVIATSRRETAGAITFDLAQDPASWPVLPHTDVAFLCAAIAKLDACEKDPAATSLINVERTVDAAKRLHDAGSFVVFLSTNHVFDGTKPQRGAAEPTCPVNQYGAQKAEAERQLLALPRTAVLRLTKVVTRPFPLFEQWKAKLQKGEQVNAFGDMAIAPVLMENVVDALCVIAREKAPGIHQLSGPADASYYDLAVTLAKNIHADAHLVRKGSFRDAGILESFSPAYSTYERTALLHGIEVPDIMEMAASVI